MLIPLRGSSEPPWFGLERFHIGRKLKTALASLRCRISGRKAGFQTDIGKELSTKSWDNLAEMGSDH
jgi:hypothetical protein